MLEWVCWHVCNVHTPLACMCPTRASPVGAPHLKDRSVLVGRFDPRAVGESLGRWVVVWLNGGENG
jgi:hypothetical protein